MNRIQKSSGKFSSGESTVSKNSFFVSSKNTMSFVDVTLFDVFPKLFENESKKIEELISFKMNRIKSKRFKSLLEHFLSLNRHFKKFFFFYFSKESNEFCINHFCMMPSQIFLKMNRMNLKNRIRLKGIKQNLIKFKSLLKNLWNPQF